MDEVSTLFQRLEYEDEKLPVLLDGKTYLVNVNPTTLKGLIKVQNISVLFKCFNTENEEQISTVVFILKLLLPIIDVREKLEILSRDLWKCLNHKYTSVQHLCLQQFRECAVTSMGNHALIEAKNIIEKIINMVESDGMSIALASAEFLSDFGSYSIDAAKVLLSGTLLEKLHSVMMKGDNVRYRVYDIIVKIQSESVGHLAVCDDSKLLSKLVNELMGDDILIRVVCIATLSEMATTKHSLQYLHKNGVVEKLILMIKNAESDSFSDLYMPEVVKFFGKMCHQEGTSNVIEIFPQFLPTISGLIDNTDVVKKKTGIETLGFIGRSVEGKNVLSKEGNRILNTITQVGSIMCSEGSDLRLISVNAICQLLHLNPSDQTEDLIALVLQWFGCISSDPVDSILGLCKQPFTSVKCAGFHLIKTLANLEFGLEALVEFPTFVEFILDRSADTDKESKDARYEAVKAIAESPRCMHIFGNNNYLKFRTYVKEGAIYEQVLNPGVALESS